MCGIAGLISHLRQRENGERIKRGIVLQNDRGNGLGAGYAAYGIYPEYKELYALHLMMDHSGCIDAARDFLQQHFAVHHMDDIPIWEGEIKDHPFFKIFFVEPKASAMGDYWSSEDDFTIDKVMQINDRLEGVYVFSSGKNMGCFKGVGEPAAIYDFFELDSYEGYIWLAHNRFPTNTPGWWGGAHPFNILNWSIVHNGEISSYGINRRYLEGYGYSCRLQTDSEVVAYLLDLLIRKHGLSIYEASLVLAPPYWSWTERAAEETLQERLLAMKVIYESAMLNGPFAVLGAFEGGLFSITDNTKLRPMTIARTKDYSYFASEIAALYEMDEDLDEVFTPRAGQPYLALINEEAHGGGAGFGSAVEYLQHQAGKSREQEFSCKE